jgi:hypothetical protein
VSPFLIVAARDLRGPCSTSLRKSAAEPAISFVRRRSDAIAGTIRWRESPSFSDPYL